MYFHLCFYIDDFKISVSRLDFSLELHMNISNHFLSALKCKSNRHLGLNTARTELWSIPSQTGILPVFSVVFNSPIFDSLALANN